MEWQRWVFFGTGIILLVIDFRVFIAFMYQWCSVLRGKIDLSLKIAFPAVSAAASLCLYMALR